MQSVTFPAPERNTRRESTTPDIAEALGVYTVRSGHGRRGGATFRSSRTFIKSGAGLRLASVRGGRL